VARCFREEEAEISTGPTYFEMMFCKSGSPRSEYWRVCIELDDNDRALLMGSRTAEMGTQALVRRLGILDLLPSGLDDSWQRFGTGMEDNVIGTWDGGSDPTIVKDGRKIWIISRRTK
jgi:hypothetical protein